MKQTNNNHIWIAVAGILFFTLLFLWETPDAQELMKDGNYYFGGGIYDLARAEKAYREAISADPKILWGHYQLARIYFIKGDYSAALGEINRELEANPENLRSLYIRGLIHGYSGNFELAEKDFRRFTLWAPKEWAGYNDLAWILSKQAKYKEAKIVLEEGFKKVPDAEKNPWLWNSLGVSQLNLGEKKMAADSFDVALKLAKKLSVNDWRAAYPGNDPKEAASGIEMFLNAILDNLQMAAK